MLRGAAAPLELLEVFEALAQHLSAGFAKEAIVSGAFAIEHRAEELDVFADQIGLVCAHVCIRCNSGSVSKRIDESINGARGVSVDGWSAARCGQPRTRARPRRSHARTRLARPLRTRRPAFAWLCRT